MKKIIIILVAFLICTVSVSAKKIKQVNVSPVKYETHDANGNIQKGTLNFTTIYIYDVKDI